MKMDPSSPAVNTYLPSGDTLILLISPKCAGILSKATGLKIAE